MHPIPQLISFSSYIWKPELLLVVLVLVIIHRIWVAYQNNQPINWPILGMFPSYLFVLKTNFHDGATRLLRDHGGTFTLKGPWFCKFEIVGTSDPRNVEHILKTNFYDFHKGRSLQTSLQDLLGGSFFSMDGDTWRWVRKMVGMKISLASYNEMAMESWFELIQSRLFPTLDDFMNQSVVFELDEVFSRLLFNQNCFTAFGVDPACCLDPKLPRVQVAKAWKNASEITDLRFFFPTFAWKLMKYFNVGREREMKLSVKQINEFVYKVIATRRKDLISENFSEHKSRSDFLSLLLESKDDQGNGFSDKFLRDNCLNVMLAGADTNSMGLSWFFWLLCQNPRVEGKIYAEISNIARESAKSDATFTLEEVKKMNYLHASLTEALRLFPPLSLNQIEVDKEGQFPNGVKLKKGVRVIISSYAMGRMASIWGNDCEEFIPEIWFKNGKFVAGSDIYKFTAFSAGLRSCLGKDLTYHLLKVVAASMIFRYRVNVVKNHPVEPKCSALMQMKYGFKVILSPRWDDS